MVDDGWGERLLYRCEELLLVTNLFTPGMARKRCHSPVKQTSVASLAVEMEQQVEVQGYQHAPSCAQNQKKHCTKSITPLCCCTHTLRHTACSTHLCQQRVSHHQHGPRL